MNKATCALTGMESRKCGNSFKGWKGLQMVLKPVRLTEQRGIVEVSGAVRPERRICIEFGNEI